MGTCPRSGREQCPRSGSRMITAPALGRRSTVSDFIPRIFQFASNAAWTPAAKVPANKGAAVMMRSLTVQHCQHILQ